MIFTPHKQSISDQLQKSGHVHEIYNDLPTYKDIEHIANKYKDISGCVILIDDILSHMDEIFKLDKNHCFGDLTRPSVHNPTQKITQVCSFSRFHT